MNQTEWKNKMLCDVSFKWFVWTEKEQPVKPNGDIVKLVITVHF